MTDKPDTNNKSTLVHDAISCSDDSTNLLTPTPTSSAPKLWQYYTIDLLLLLTITIFKLRGFVTKTTVCLSKLTLHFLEIPLFILVGFLNICYSCCGHQGPAVIENTGGKLILNITNVHDLYWTGKRVTMVQFQEPIAKEGHSSHTSPKSPKKFSLLGVYGTNDGDHHDILDLIVSNNNHHLSPIQLNTHTPQPLNTTMNDGEWPENDRLHRYKHKLRNSNIFSGSGLNSNNTNSTTNSIGPTRSN